MLAKSANVARGVMHTQNNNIKIKNVYRLLIDIDIVGVLIDTKAFVCLFVT
jgi:hypothetical protein